MSRMDEPLFQVIKGSPTEEELAALVAVFSLRSGGVAAEAEPRASGWSAYWRSVRAPVQPGPEAWRMSGRPQ
jgi:Acyl-CoA carboxylase epsilon subunit